MLERLTTLFFWRRYWLPPSSVAPLGWRAWLALLGLAPVAAGIEIVVLSLLIFGLSWVGLFLPLVRLGLGTEPAAWVLWTGDPALLQMICFAIFSVLSGFLLPGWPLVTTLALILLFPGFMSIKGATVLFLGERLGARLWLLRQKDVPGAPLFRRTEWLVTTVFRAGLLFLWVFFAQLVQPVFVELLSIDSIFHPGWRSTLVILVVGLGLCIETILNMGFLHFYFQSGKGQALANSPHPFAKS